jgi:hypothetical protein
VKYDVYVPTVPIALSNFKDRIRKATANINQPLLQNIWREVQYRPDVCRATNAAHIKLTLSVKKNSELLFTMMCI